MEEKRTSRRNGRDTQTKKDYVFFSALMQMLSCMLVLLLLFLLSRGDAARAQMLRSDYALILSRQLRMQEIEEAVDAVREFFLPQSATAAVMAQPDEATTVPMAPSAPAQTSDADPSDAQKASTQPDTTKTLQSAAKQETQPRSLAAGGKDEAKPKAKQTASLSPSAVTVPITRPVEGGRYSSYFGYRNNPITHQYAFHTGLDIAVPLGTKIRAAYGGTVSRVGEDSRSGKYVILSHDDGFETFYCHCSEILVPRGTVVRAGEAVACVGSTGWSTGPHLHFEIRKNGTRLDPLQILEHDV